VVVPLDQSIRHWQALQLSLSVWDLSGIDSWVLNDSVSFAMSASYYPLGSTAELANVGHLEVGSYALNVSVSDTQGNWAIAIFIIEVTQQVELQLSGSFDFLLKEEIHLQLAALLSDKDTGQPISGATTFVEIYDPDGVLLVNESMIEEIQNSGIYVYTSAMTLKDWKLPKGIYLVQAYAQVANDVEAFDMIQFHIDPPSDSPVNPFALIGILVLIIGVTISLIILFTRNKQRNWVL
jgi:hypothetical protein